MERMIVGILLCVLGMVSGCATVTTGTGQSITVVTEKNVESAKCELTDIKGGKWYVDNTPGTVIVTRGDGPMSVVCKKDGFKSTTLMVEEVIAGATLGNIILGGGIGIFVDAMSGAAQRYPDQIIVWMEPEKWGSEKERLAWINVKEAYEAELAAKQKELQQSSPTQFGGK